MNNRMHWLLWLCHCRRVLLIHLAANDNCHASSPFFFLSLFCCQNCGCCWHPTGTFVLLQIQFTAALVKALWKGEGGRWKLTLLNGQMQVWETIMNLHLLPPSENWLLKEWGCRGRYPKTGAPFIDVWSLRFSAAFPPAYCLLVYLSYLSGPSEDRKITLEGSEENSSGPLPPPCVGLLITFS